MGSPVCQTGLSPQYQSLKHTYQLRVHVHNHITQAVAATDSGFAIVGAHQHVVAVGSHILDPSLPSRVQSTSLSASSTVNKWYLLAGNRKTVLPRHAYGGGMRKLTRVLKKSLMRGFFPLH